MPADFDTLSVAERLEREGFDARQAKALAHAIAHAIAGARSNLDAASRADLMLVKDELRMEIVTSKNDLGSRMAAIEAEVKALGDRMTIRFAMIAVAVVAAIEAFNRLFPPPLSH
jgi:hypothetical protein